MYTHHTSRSPSAHQAMALAQPAYCVFSNAELDALVAARPTSLTDLRQVKGFGPVKCEKFGAGIIRLCASKGFAAASQVTPAAPAAKLFALDEPGPIVQNPELF
jgi:hypothetical protein